MTQLTLQISEPLAQELALLATEQKKSIEQIAVENLESSVKGQSRRGSAAAILNAIRSSPPIDRDLLDEMERIIEAGQLPPINRGIFDEDEAR